MFSFISGIQNDNNQLEFNRLYENEAIERVSNDYWQLLSSNPKEELVQNFIEKNPILLQSFNPIRIFHKSPILSKYKTGLTILEGNGNLFLVEIENSNIKLLTKNSEIAKGLEHAMKQVDDWRFEFEQHKQACLSCIGLEEKEVTRIIGVVIAGVEKNYPREHLTKLKWRIKDNLQFLTMMNLVDEWIVLETELVNCKIINNYQSITPV